MAAGECIFEVSIIPYGITSIGLYHQLVLQEPPRHSIGAALYIPTRICQGLDSATLSLGLHDSRLSTSS